MRCLNNGLWLSGPATSATRSRCPPTANTRMSPGPGSRWPCPPARQVPRRATLLRRVGKRRKNARSYRGKILSLDTDGRLSRTGAAASRSPSAKRFGREEVVLPEQTLRLLDRNVLNFVAAARTARARPVDPQGHPALWPARHRQDPHHPLSRQQSARHHHTPHHRRAGRPARRIT